MPERLPAIKRLDALLSAAMIAHEAIFEVRRELIATDRANPEQARLLEESARIVTTELPGLTARARQLSAQWGEQSLLDPAGATGTSKELEAELQRIEPSIQSRLTGNERSPPGCARCWSRRATRPKRGGLLPPARSDQPAPGPHRDIQLCPSAPLAREAPQPAPKAPSPAAQSAPVAPPSTQATNVARRECLAKDERT